MAEMVRKAEKRFGNVKSGSQKCKKNDNKMYMLLVTKCHN